MDNIDLNKQVEEYAQKFKEFNEEILKAVKVCFKHSLTYRKHIISPYFGEVKGWRITWMWTENVKDYPQLKFVGPLDLGLYSIRIDTILGRTDMDEFLSDALGVPMFQRYISATGHFISKLIKNGEAKWAVSEPNPPIQPALDLCEEYSPTFKKVRKRLQETDEDAWDIVKLWISDPTKIHALRRIFPLDIAIYCVRLDSITFDIDLTDFKKEADKMAAFDLFPKEISQFILEILCDFWGS